MPTLAGFSDNPLHTKTDITRACEALLHPLLPYFSKHHARVRIPVESAAHFDDLAAQLEGYARPLWVVGALLSEPDATGGIDAHNSLLQPWIDGLQYGVDPSSPEFWGDIVDMDQRMVEAEIISFALLTAPRALYDPLSDDCKEHLANWLYGLNGKAMPENNWRWFRVMSNLALIKVCGRSKEQLWPLMERDLQTLDSFDIGDGWSADGPWRPVTEDPEDEGAGPSAAYGRHADYYSGSFAIQFSQLLYSKLAADLDPSRAAKYRERARQFSRTFWRYFDCDGAGIPFGRSLTYRFAMSGFYAAFACAGLCDDSDPLMSHGAIKGMLLRNLRWWATNSEGIFWPDGTLNIGFVYPNMYMAEPYNSPQSPYWALKSLIVAALPAAHPFWAAEELAHPLLHDTGKQPPVHVAGVDLVKPARQILCNHEGGSHHFLLSSGPFAVWPMKVPEAKYSKFAYSSSFGFSVPAGGTINQIAPDNTLALSLDDGDTWAVRWISVGETTTIEVPVNGEMVPAMVNRWRPWRKRALEVETTLVAPCSQWPDWHVRVHRVRSVGSGLRQGESFTAVEGGFAIDGRRRSDGRSLWNGRAQGGPDTPLSAYNITDGSEGAFETSKAAFVLSAAGASGIMDLSPPGPFESTTGEVMKTDPNTNLLTPRTLLPIIRKASSDTLTQDFVLATAVFAISSKPGPKHRATDNLGHRWAQTPRISWDQGGHFALA
ncbi:hypothetical protein JDV02_000120 [Purpureocillium takamizusanense]|uniref:DUF2264 domain-containing protein n=1 Tax=Purpureocillium takamizusanense TaxID=2060973 RepID=A0A9Q8V556_9HYPO|nr:uncharacterized protein JDV02_000120 [Purpureocillium takamizusanense]UNI13370.1 hypothetical protein JDV02_000120 [Purpureocillium takamizusanense]